MGQLGNDVLAGIVGPIEAALREGNAKDEELTERLDAIVQQRAELRQEMKPLKDTLRRIKPDHELVQRSEPPQANGTRRAGRPGGMQPETLERVRAALPADGQPFSIRTLRDGGIAYRTAERGLEELRELGEIRLAGAGPQGGRQFMVVEVDAASPGRTTARSQVLAWIAKRLAEPFTALDVRDALPSDVSNPSIHTTLSDLKGDGKLAVLEADFRDRDGRRRKLYKVVENAD